MDGRYEMLRVDAIEFDRENPRIKKALEKYGDQLDAERIHFALRTASGGAKGTSSYSSLRDSIRASRGVMAPVTVVNTQNKYVCIDGNTRVAIYKQFLREGVEGNWSEIKAIVLLDADQRAVEEIRVSAHLVGAREWPAYEKARYLHYLRNQHFMDYSEMIALCGGNKTDIEREIDAYHEMNEYYRDRVDDDAFHIDRFSGFRELQKPRIKEAIFDAGLELKDFGEWIRDGKIYRMESVRDLPKVLDDDDARSLFLNGGPRSIEEATKLVDQKAENESDQRAESTTLETASVSRLARVLARRINDMPYSEIRSLKDKEHEGVEEQIQVLEDLSGRLLRLLQDVSE